MQRSMRTTAARGKPPVLGEDAEGGADRLLVGKRPSSASSRSGRARARSRLRRSGHQPGVLGGEDPVPDPLGTQGRDDLADLGDPVGAASSLTWIVTPSPAARACLMSGTRSRWGLTQSSVGRTIRSLYAHGGSYGRSGRNSAHSSRVRLRPATAHARAFHRSGSTSQTSDPRNSLRAAGDCVLGWRDACGPPLPHRSNEVVDGRLIPNRGLPQAEPPRTKLDSYRRRFASPSCSSSIAPIRSRARFLTARRRARRVTRDLRLLGEPAAIAEFVEAFDAELRR
jgi:hypothetical protein